MDKVYKCPSCAAEPKEGGGVQLAPTIKSLSLMAPEILDNMDVKCWKCGATTTASELVKRQGSP